MPDNTSLYICLGLGLLVAVPYAIKAGRYAFSPVTSVKATVVHKQTVETFSKYEGSGKRVKYAVTFSANGKKRSFYVSEFSYRGYRKGESGTLTYKGDRLIDFH